MDCTAWFTVPFAADVDLCLLLCNTNGAAESVELGFKMIGAGTCSPRALHCHRLPQDSNLPRGNVFINAFSMFFMTFSMFQSTRSIPHYARGITFSPKGTSCTCRPPNIDAWSSDTSGSENFLPGTFSLSPPLHCQINRKT